MSPMPRGALRSRETIGARIHRCRWREMRASSMRKGGALLIFRRTPRTLPAMLGQPTPMAITLQAHYHVYLQFNAEARPPMRLLPVQRLEWRERLRAQRLPVSRMHPDRRSLQERSGDRSASVAAARLVLPLLVARMAAQPAVQPKSASRCIMITERATRYTLQRRELTAHRPAAASAVRRRSQTAIAGGSDAPQLPRGRLQANAGRAAGVTAANTPRLASMQSQQALTSIASSAPGAVAQRRERHISLAHRMRPASAAELAAHVAEQRVRLPRRSVIAQRAVQVRVAAHPRPSVHLSEPKLRTAAQDPLRCAVPALIVRTVAATRVRESEPRMVAAASLVWRKAWSSAAASAETLPPSAAPTAPASASVSLVTSTRRAAATSTLPQATLSGAALERLTDDVMRRIERRVRRERERRGL